VTATIVRNIPIKYEKCHEIEVEPGTPAYLDRSDLLATSSQAITEQYIGGYSNIWLPLEFLHRGVDSDPTC
jgi:hypothetical protein